MIRGIPSWCRALLASAILAVGIGTSQGASEASVKAAYLYNFAKLVDWPASAFDRAQAPIVIGVVGRDAVADELTRGFAKATVNGRPLEIRRVSAGNAGALRACHIVFVPESENADAIVAAVQGHPVLVVGEAEGFARRGGALAFVKVNETVKFEANPKAAARSGVAVSSKLLRVAQNVVN
jgi:hypothetical protein